MSQYNNDNTGSGTLVVETLTPNVGGAVSPTAGTINVLGNSQRAAAVGATTDGGGVFSTGTPASSLVRFTYESFGTNNTFLGYGAGNNTLTVLNAVQNVGIGSDALHDITTANEGVAVGYLAAANVTTSAKITAVGALALSTGTTGVARSTAIGDLALTTATGANNTALGCEALDTLTSGSDNLALGNNAGSAYTGAESSNILLMASGTVGESNVCRIGTTGSGAGQVTNTYLAGIVNLPQGQTVALTSVTATPHNAATTEYVLACNLAGALSVVLPAATGSGRTYRIKDVSGAAAANNITVTSAGATFDGAASSIINTNYGSNDYIDTATNVWSIF